MNGVRAESQRHTFGVRKDLEMHKHVALLVLVVGFVDNNDNIENRKSNPLPVMYSYLLHQKTHL